MNMKRFLLYAFLGLGSLPMLTGCYEDKSTEAEFLIPEIEIDTVGFNAPWNDDYDRYTISVQQFDKLQLSFPVKQEGISNPDYSYEWKLTMAPESSGGASLSFMTISEEKDLEYEIIQAPNSRPYILWYQVTDNATGIKKGMVWAIKILAPYNEGLIVAESNDGSNTDLAFVSSGDFTVGHSGEAKVSHNLYTNANEGQPIQGLLQGMLFYQRSVSGQGTMNHFMVYGKDFFQHIDNGFKYAGRDTEVSYDGEQTFAPTQLDIYGSSSVIFINEGRIYPIVTPNVPKMTVNIPELFTHPVTGLSAETEVDKYIAMRRDSEYKSGVGYVSSWGCWYDKKNGIFMLQQQGSPTYRNGCNTFPTLDNPIFDPNNVPGLDTRATGLDMDKNFVFVMKNTLEDKYQIYVFKSTTVPEPLALYDLPASESSKLDAAQSYFVSDNGKIIYFATKNAVYAIQLDATVPTVNEIYSSSEEITHFSMFTQAFQLLSGSSAQYYPEKCLASHHNMLILGTWNGSKGTLTTLPIVNPATGEIDTAAIKNYTGFGKILTVIHHQ